MAEFIKPGGPDSYIPPITQEALANLIGTTLISAVKFPDRNFSYTPGKPRMNSDASACQRRLCRVRALILANSFPPISNR